MQPPHINPFKRIGSYLTDPSSILVCPTQEDFAGNGKVFIPTNRQEEVMRDVCRQLGMSYDNTMATICNQDEFSDKLHELCDKAKKHREQLPATAKQVSLMQRLKVPKKDMQHATRAQASQLIAEHMAKQAAHSANASITKAQRDTLVAMGYKGPMPQTRSVASRIISTARQAKAAAHFVARARNMGISDGQLKRLQDFLARVPADKFTLPSSN